MWWDTYQGSVASTAPGVLKNVLCCVSDNRHPRVMPWEVVSRYIGLMPAVPRTSAERVCKKVTVVWQCDTQKNLWWSLCAESKAVVSTFTWVRLKLRILLGHSGIKFAVPKFSWKKICQVIRLSFGSRWSTHIQLFPYRKYRIDSTIVTATVLHNRIGIYFYFSRSSTDPSNNKAARISASHDGGYLSTRKPWLYFCQLANSESCTHAHSPLGSRVPRI